MDNLERRLERYVAFKGKPFSLDECVMEVGVAKGIVLDGLRALERDGKVREVRGLWIPLGDREEAKGGRHDFRFKYLEKMLGLFGKGKWLRRADLDKGFNMSKETLIRGIRTACYMGLLQNRQEGRMVYYKKVKDYAGEPVPWFYREVVPGMKVRW